jgi:subtilisin family serine protease
MTFTSYHSRQSLLLACLVLLLGLSSCTKQPPSFSGASFLNVRPANVLTSQQSSSEIILQNPTRSSVTWNIVLEPDPNNPQTGDWFSLSQTQGSTGGNGTTTLSLSLNAGLAPGLYSTTLRVLYQEKEERHVVVGQISGTTTGTAQLTGQITTDNALIPVSEAAESTTFFSTDSPAERYVPGQILVKYKEADVANGQTPSPQQLNTQQLETRQNLLQSLQADYQLRVLESGFPGQADLLETSQDVEALARTLTNDPRVEYATPNYYLKALELPNDPSVNEQWALAVTGLPVAWQVETGSSNPVTVAVLDTGFDLDHEDLAGRFLPGYDFCAKLETVGEGEDKRKVCGRGDNDPSFVSAINIHGTHVAGLLAASGDNGKGIVGAAYGSNVKLIPVKIFDDLGNFADINSFAKGIRWAVGLEVNGVPINENPARIINLSLGGKFDNEDGSVNTAALEFMQDAVDDADFAGALIVAASGNDGDRFVRSPAAANHVIGVGFVGETLRLSSFSNTSEVKRYGPGVVDLVAPGENLLSTIPGGDYGLLSGTSMSTPMVSGIAALLLSREPQLSSDELEQRLLAATYFDQGFMKETKYGKGVLRADLAFGLPGPGSTVTVAVGSSTQSALTTTTLDVYGNSSPFTLPNLSAGTYRFVAVSNGAGGQLLNSQNVTLQDAEQKTLDAVITK